MSSPILPAQGPVGLPSTIPSATTPLGGADGFIAQLSTDAPAPALEAARGGPPPEVLDAIAAAGALAQQLSESGYQMRFLSSPHGERTRIEIHDADGCTVSILAAAEAVEMAIATPID
jgi:hypothetical protein